MKAIRMVEVGAPLEIHDVPVVEPTPDEVTIRVAGCGVCHTDIGFWVDGVPTRKELPLTLGHEVSGTVTEAGSRYAHLEGRPVIVPAMIPCGECDLCVRGRGNACRNQIMPGNDLDGGFAQYLTVPGRGLCAAEDTGDCGLAEVAVLADAVTTPYQAIVRSGLAAGDLAVVVGVGGVGGFCAQIAAALGAHVIAVDVDDGRLRAIADHGPRLTLNSGELEFRSLRKEVAAREAEWGCPPHGRKVFECSGHPGGQETAFGLINHASTLMVVGFTLAKTELRLSNLMAFDATAQGTWGCLPELYPAALSLVTEGRIALKPFVRSFPMSQGPEVLAQVADHGIRERAILVPDWET
ncbi:MAG: 6-hydroxycyclohex-1-ene-1-carbonyl-CoA dehydrogenase [Candidatus Palauibacterales bacterium]|jgi:6-hydroxycyclohex-1-ene-1-carbonyl-CoA dehydrogenase|nr:6-hydroxycyclohex-1-ene-1-carbonyl-CoA dehydrogenase [Candidatus Palauibacterales bacterium]